MEQKPNLIDCLNYQKGTKHTFFEKIPSFKKQLDECNKTLLLMQDKFESIKRREIYKTMIEEFKDLVEKKRIKQE